MNITTTRFVRELQTKELNKYSLSEIQQALQGCHSLYVRFRSPNERGVLINIWNKLAIWYNHLLITRFNELDILYPIDYLQTIVDEPKVKKIKTN